MKLKNGRIVLEDDSVMSSSVCPTCGEGANALSGQRSAGSPSVPRSKNIAIAIDAAVCLLLGLTAVWVVLALFP
jgi:hypothetical protein